MCDPVTMTTLAVVAGGTQAYSQYSQGRAAEATGNYNARELENQATSIRNKGAEEENIKRRETAEFASKQRAMLGASGIDIDTGSAGDLQEDTQLLGEVDALRIRRNYAEKADTTDRQAVQTKAEGRAAKRAANLAAMGTVLTTAATAGMINAPAPTGGGQVLAGSPMNSKWYTDASAFMLA
jgi:hypothetical protein